MIAPVNVVPFALTDTGDMGDVSDNTNLRARFKLGHCDDGYALSHLSVRNSGGSAGRAELSLRVDHRLGPAFDFRPVAWKDFGNGAVSDKSHIKWIIEDWEMRAWTFWRDPATGILDELVFEWSNPNTQIWAIELGLVDVRYVPER